MSYVHADRIYENNLKLFTLYLWGPATEGVSLLTSIKSSKHVCHTTCGGDGSLILSGQPG